MELNEWVSYLTMEPTVFINKAPYPTLILLVLILLTCTVVHSSHESKLILVFLYTRIYLASKEKNGKCRIKYTYGHRKVSKLLFKDVTANQKIQ